VLATMAALRRDGLACDTDYAGRSLKGQLTQASRTGALATVIVKANEAIVRRPERSDHAISLDELAATLRS
jgi:histidyl-tRNA synthetase